MTLNDPALVAEQYSTEAGLEARRSIYADAEGPDPRELAFAAVAETRPSRVVEVGGGPGEVAERIVRELGADVKLVDISARMVELARARGLDAVVGDVQDLPFDDGTFDCAVAAWMLYHVPDLDRGLAELARVLRPGGRLVAVTNGQEHLRELAELAGRGTIELPFTRENGKEALRRHFTHVERRDADGWVTFPDGDAVRRYVASTITMRSELIADYEGPLRARRAVSVFVAER